MILHIHKATFKNLDVIAFANESVARISIDGQIVGKFSTNDFPKRAEMNDVL